MKSSVPVWRVAHWTPKIYLTLACVTPLLVALEPDPLAVVVFVALFLLEILLIIVFFRHQQALCGTCASMTVLDGKAEAKRQDRKLRIYHNVWFGMIGSSALLICLVIRAVFDLPFAGRVGYSISLVCTALQLGAWNMHRLLAPYCRYCPGQWEHDGPREEVPSPHPPFATDQDTPM